MAKVNPIESILTKWRALSPAERDTLLQVFRAENRKPRPAKAPKAAGDPANA